MDTVRAYSSSRAVRSNTFQYIGGAAVKRDGLRYLAKQRRAKPLEQFNRVLPTTDTNRGLVDGQRLA